MLSVLADISSGLLMMILVNMSGWLMFLRRIRLNTSSKRRWRQPRHCKKLASELEVGISDLYIGIPKTIDNDLPITDSSPGFGSVAKYVATSTLEASLDVRSMAESSTKVFLFEVMGRNAGWIAASSGQLNPRA